MKYKIIVIFLLVVVYIFNYIKIDNYNLETSFNVTVKGDVEQSKTYIVNKGDTIDELLRKVELNDSADISNLDLTHVLKNNEIIYINSKNEIKGKVNINLASKEELMTLKGIGDKTSDLIIEYRINTPFRTIEDIKNIKGIGDKSFDKIKDDITV